MSELDRYAGNLRDRCVEAADPIGADVSAQLAALDAKAVRKHTPQSQQELKALMRRFRDRGVQTWSGVDDP